MDSWGISEAFLSTIYLQIAGLGLIATVTVYFVARALQPARVQFYYGRDSIILRAAKNGSQSTFADICKSITPKCRLNPFLLNGHLQTICNSFLRPNDTIHYKRWMFEQKDPKYPGTFAIDFVIRPDKDSDLGSPRKTDLFTEEAFRKIGTDDSKPMLVVLHGLGGGSHERYLRDVLLPLVSETGGWEACVVIARGCSGTKITSNLLYTANSTWDLKQAVDWLRETFPNRPLYGLGFSLGANYLTNYVADEGNRCVLKAAVAISNPWNMEVSIMTMQRTWVGREVYLRSLGMTLKRLFFRHLEKIMKTPGIDIKKVQKVRYFQDFDRAVQLPMWGYPTEGAYYRDTGSADSLLAIRIPFFAVNAIDDPIAVDEGIPRQEFRVSPYAVLCTTSHGGHLGWFELGGKRWITKAVESFFQRMHREVGSQNFWQNQFPCNGHTMQEKFPGRMEFDPVKRKMH